MHMLGFPSKGLDNCKKFRELSPKHKGIILEEHNGCLLCTSYTYNRIRCYQRRRIQSVTSCGMSEDDKVCGRKHHLTLHLSMSHYCMATTLPSSSTPGPAFRTRVAKRAELGRPAHECETCKECREKIS